MIAFKYSKDLQDVIGGHPIKVVYKDKMKILCCLYIVNMQTFMNHLTI